ncbi:hypothetical protein LMQOC2_21463 [Listeria monocytogenes QOC2]|nr:hypothetical protein LMQOC2_21463 [Listeria monocytogenes QOC2]
MSFLSYALIELQMTYSPCPNDYIPDLLEYISPPLQVHFLYMLSPI